MNLGSVSGSWPRRAGNYFRSSGGKAHLPAKPSGRGGGRGVAWDGKVSPPG